jgi:hypothetical protein
MISPAIDPRQIGWVLGQFLLILGATMLLPLLHALIGDSEGIAAFAAALAVTLGSALLLLGLCRGREDREIKQREAIMLVVLVWFAVGAPAAWAVPWPRGPGDQAARGDHAGGAGVVRGVRLRRPAFPVLPPVCRL